MELYTYCVRVDNGSAPNPFFNVCTLAICKPVIRRTAQIGDWVVGTGSSKYDMQNKIVYAMKVTDIKSMKAYDEYCQQHLIGKTPDVKSKDISRRLGDCIYQYQENAILMRKGVHDERNRTRDLKGENVLLSQHFYYFGSNPMPLPSDLLKIVRNGQGHRSVANKPFVQDFENWIRSLKLNQGIQESMPYNYDGFKDVDCFEECSKLDKCIDDEDEESGND
jgi:hypothetical protein